MTRFIRDCDLRNANGSAYPSVPYSDNRFKKICQVGEGYGGRVVKSVDKHTGDVVALKIIDLKKANYSRAVDEVRNHNRLQHQNIIRLRHVFTRTDRFVYLVLDYAELGDMHQFLLGKRSGVLPENMAKYFFRQIIEGVASMHSQGIVSRDIKLANILVQANNDTEEQLPTIKLCDFGFSCDCRENDTKSVVGTPEYVPPEIIHADGIEPYDGFKVDSWSCAVVLFNLVTGHQPFSGIKVGAKYDKVTTDSFIAKILAVDYSFPSDIHLSEDCISLIRGCFVKDPERRMSIADIQKHPWLNQTRAEGMTKPSASGDCDGVANRVLDGCL